MSWRWAEYTDLAKKAECWVTDGWAAEAILKKELMTHQVIDPCCGDGVLTKAAIDAGYEVFASDLYDWGFGKTGVDFLRPGYLDHLPHRPEQFTVFMNPPFSLAEEFVDAAMDYNARKIICFQRFAWWEGQWHGRKGRGEWWSTHTPNRVYVCGDRASCWRIDIPPSERGTGTPTAHAWFVWERGQFAGPALDHVYKPEAA